MLKNEKLDKIIIWRTKNEVLPIPKTITIIYEETF